MQTKKFAPLTRQAFEEFGDVIEVEPHSPVMINRGQTEKFASLSTVQTHSGGMIQVHIFRSVPYAIPFAPGMLEKHPLGSQTFLPAADDPFLIIVAPPGDVPDPETVQGFITDGNQGITYHPGVWHHPLMSLNADNTFYVIDRVGDGENLVEFFFDQSIEFSL